MEAVRKNGYIVDTANMEAPVWANKDFVVSIVQRNSRALEYSSSDTWGNMDVTYAAFKQLGLDFEHHISMRDLMLADVHEDGFASGCASDLLRADKGVVETAIEQNSVALKFARPPSTTTMHA